MYQASGEVFWVVGGGVRELDSGHYEFSSGRTTQTNKERLKEVETKR